MQGYVYVVILILDLPRPLAVLHHGREFMSHSKPLQRGSGALERVPGMYVFGASRNQDCRKDERVAENRAQTHESGK